MPADGAAVLVMVFNLLWFCSFFSTGYHLPHNGLTRPSPHIGPPVHLKEQLLIHQ